MLEGRPGLERAARRRCRPRSAQLLRRCLVRDPKQRLQSIGDARIALAESLARPGGPAWRPSSSRRARRLARDAAWLPWALFALAAAGLAASLGAARAAAATTPRPPLRLAVAISDRAARPEPRRRASALARRHAARLRRGRRRRAARCCVRSLDRLDAASSPPATGRRAPYHPFFSPDGEWIGFVDATELRKVPVTGGTPRPSARSSAAAALAGAGRHASSSPRAPPAGSCACPRRAASRSRSRRSTRRRTRSPIAGRRCCPAARPCCSPRTPSRSDFDTAALEVVVVETGERKVVHSGGYYGRYVPTGHLVYVNQATLFAVPFDLEAARGHGLAGARAPGPRDQRRRGRRRSSTSPTPACWSTSRPRRRDRVSRRLGGPRGPRRRRCWPSPASTPTRGSRPTASGSRSRSCATTTGTSGSTTSSAACRRRLTFDDAAESGAGLVARRAVPDLQSDKDGLDSLYRKRADGSGEVERLTDERPAQWATSWSRDGARRAHGVGHKGGIDLR